MIEKFPEFPKLSKISVIPEEDKESIWSLWEFMSTQNSTTIYEYSKDIKKVAKLLDLSPIDLKEYTGLEYDENCEFDPFCE